jgi:hypothetical protein
MSARKKRRKKRKARHGSVSVEQPARNGANRQPPVKLQMKPSGSADEIERLISQGKSKTALSKAKLYHKARGTAKSEKILVDAYVARIREMLVKNLHVEAKTLLEVVTGRYDCRNNVLAELHGIIAVREGRVDELVRPLDDPALSREKRAAIEKIIKSELVDLNLLTQSNVLSSNHPLKTGARAVVEAFAKVTSGFVQSEEIALPTISQRSPLAPWKMLIKAVALFYRHDDALCEKYLRAVDTQSAPGRLVPLIREMIPGKPTGNQFVNSSSLAKKIIGDFNRTRDALQKLDKALTAKKPHKLLKATRNAVNLCGQTCPDIMERLKQHISIGSWLVGNDAENVNKALGGASLKNAYFWQLFGRAAELKGDKLWACAMLEEFRKHALYEGWFSEKDREVAAIYLYMTGLLKRLPAEDFEWLQSEFENEFMGFESYYHDQPRAVREAVCQDNAKPFDTYFLYPEFLYRRAGQIDPSAETFRQWLEWVENQESHWKKCDEVALAWHAAIPDDTRPLLYLMKSSRKRNALNKALGYLDKAERIDGLNPDVKRARLRLLAAAAVRHLKQKKTHLAQKDFLEIERLPQSAEGDRPAFVVALKLVCAIIDGDESQSVRLNRELITLLEYPPAAEVVVQGLLANCGLSDRQTGVSAYNNDSLQDHDLVTAIARGCKLADDMGITAMIPPGHAKKMESFFSGQNNSPDPAAAGFIAETALRDDDVELAYAAAGAGLVQQGGATAKLLLLRARSLPAWEIERRNDCISAAIELARRKRDMDLIDEAIELRRVENFMPFGFSLFGNIIGEDNSSLDTEELNEILQFEKEAREYPSMSPGDFLDYDEDDDDDDSKCRYCDAKNCPERNAPHLPARLEFEDYDDDDIDEFPDFIEFLNGSQSDMPSDLVSLIKKVFSKHGRNGTFPNRLEVARKDPWLADQLFRELQTAESDGALPDSYLFWFPGW